MSQNIRILIVVGIVLFIGLVLAGLGVWQLMQPAPPASAPVEGMIHVYVNGAFKANISPAEIDKLPKTSFTDAEQGKTQDGPWLKDVILTYVDARSLSPTSEVRVEGTHRTDSAAKTAIITWAEATDERNHVILDVSGDGLTVKLVSTLPRLDERDEWVQGVSRIEVVTQP